MVEIIVVIGLSKITVFVGMVGMSENGSVTNILKIVDNIVSQLGLRWGVTCRCGAFYLSHNIM